MSVSRSVEWGVLTGTRKIEYGIRRWGNADLRRMYREDIDPQIAALGLQVPREDFDRKIL